MLCACPFLCHYPLTLALIYFEQHLALLFLWLILWCYALSQFHHVLQIAWFFTLIFTSINYYYMALQYIEFYGCPSILFTIILFIIISPHKCPFLLTDHLVTHYYFVQLVRKYTIFHAILLHTFACSRIGGRYRWDWLVSTLCLVAYHYWQLCILYLVISLNWHNLMDCNLFASIDLMISIF